MSHAPYNGNFEIGDIAEFVRVVGFRENCLRKILANFSGIDIDTERELDITNVITGEAYMHDARYKSIVCGIFVELDTLYQRGCAVSHAYDRHAHFFVCHEILYLLV